MSQTTLMLIAAVYVIINIVALGMYVSDKHKAKSGKWRTKESVLLAWALVGPFGAAAGMQMARHKTKKAKFKLVYVFLLIHLAAIAYIFIKL
jgi:uncharacterized membrane protein YsdA (DUF1294 family)